MLRQPDGITGVTARKLTPGVAKAAVNEIG